MISLSDLPPTIALASSASFVSFRQHDKILQISTGIAAWRYVVSSTVSTTGAGQYEQDDANQSSKLNQHSTLVHASPALLIQTSLETTSVTMTMPVQTTAALIIASCNYPTALYGNCDKVCARATYGCTFPLPPQGTQPTIGHAEHAAAWSTADLTDMVVI